MADDIIESLSGVSVPLKSIGLFLCSPKNESRKATKYTNPQQNNNSNNQLAIKLQIKLQETIFQCLGFVTRRRGYKK